MSARLTITPKAARDLERIRRWLTQPGSGTNAALRLRRIFRAIDDLAEAPLRWPESKDHRGRRQRVVDDYAIVYRLRWDRHTGEADEVTVLRVFGPRQRRTFL